MTLFKKKEAIPEIPEAPEPTQYSWTTQKKEVTEINHFPEEQENSQKIEITTKNSNEINHLPEVYGDNKNQETQEKIKSAVIDNPPEKIERLPLPQGFEESRGLPPLKQESITYNSVPEPPIKNEEIEVKELSFDSKESNDANVKKDANETIFVRIDKFNLAKKDTQQISREIKTVENVLEKLTSTKMQEDEEVAEIGKLLEEIKEKISKMESEVFNRI